MGRNLFGRWTFRRGLQGPPSAAGLAPKNEGASCTNQPTAPLKGAHSLLRSSPCANTQPRISHRPVSEPAFSAGAKRHHTCLDVSWWRLNGLCISHPVINPANNYCIERHQTGMTSTLFELVYPRRVITDVVWQGPRGDSHLTIVVFSHK